MPFAGYRDFDECVRKNRDKDDPDAYCASIQRSVEGTIVAAAGGQSGEWVSASPLKAEAGDGVLPGAARGTVTGVLSVIRSERTGVLRYSVNGQTVDPDTIEPVDVPDTAGERA